MTVVGFLATFPFCVSCAFSWQINSELPASLLREIIRLVAGLPLDIATEAGSLCASNGLSIYKCIKCGAEVFAGDGNSVSGAAIIQLAAIDEAMIAVEEKEIGRASRTISVSHGLRFIVEVREVVSGGAGFILHFCGTVIRITGCVV